MAKFYICKKCGNLVAMINASGAPMICCGEKMTELVAGTVEASHEKHIPVAEYKDGKVAVTVGSVIHPMIPEHSILWVCLETDKGIAIKYLNPGEEPTVTFSLEDEKPLAVYEYCNLHGLWKADV